MKKVLFICSGNSARSIMAEELLRRKGGAAFAAYSAGTRPEDQVHPLAVQALAEIGVDVAGRKPRSVTELQDEPFEIILTLCDKAREECPIFPGRPIRAHWGFPDPALFEGTEEQRLAVFRRTLMEIGNRINLFLLLEGEKTDRDELERRIQEIGEGSC